MAPLLQGIKDFIEKARSALFGPSIIFEVTPRCNLACKYCYNVWKVRPDYPQGEMPADDVKVMLGRLLGETCSRHLTFTGGEPLLREDLEEIAVFLRDNGVAMTMVTNGTLLTEERAQSLFEAGVSMFELPLLAAEPALHDDLAGAEAFHSTVEAYANARLAGGRVAAVFVATAKNITQWPEVIKLALALGAEGLSFNRFNPGGQGVENIAELALTDKEQLREALHIANEAVDKYGLQIDVPLPTPPCVFSPKEFPNLQFVGCAAGTKNAYWTLDALGNLRPCNHSPTILGNVLEQSFGHIVASQKAKCWVGEVAEQCQGCKWLSQCRGGCKASAEVCYGSLKRTDPFVTTMRGQDI